jgi:hypothetical protein
MPATITGAGRPAGDDTAQPDTAPVDDAEARALAAALRDTRTAAAWLAVRFRAYALRTREPAAFARAAAVTAAAQALGQACLLASRDSTPGTGRPDIPLPVGPPNRPAGAEEIAQLLAGTQLLRGALSALASQAGLLGPHAPQLMPPDCLAGVQVSLQAARQHLTRAWEPADDGAPCAGQPSTGNPPGGTALR